MGVLDSFAQLAAAASRLPAQLLSSVDVSAVLMIAAAVLALVKPRGLSLRSRLARWTGMAIVGCAFISSVLVLLEYALHFDFAFEQLLMPAIDREAGAPAVVAVPLALSFAWLSIALLMRYVDRPPRRDTADLLALFSAIAVAVFVVVRFETGARSEVEGRCVISALTLLALAIAVAVTRPHGSITRIVRSNAITAQFMRPLLIVIVVTPVATDHVTEALARLGVYTHQTEKAVDTIISTLVLLAVTVVITRIVARTEFKRQEAQEKLKESESRLKLQFEAMPVACMTRDPEFRVQSWNPAAEAIFGFTAEEMIGRSSDVLIPPERREQIDDLCRRMLAGQRDGQSTGELMSKDGRRIVCRWSNAPIVGADGKIFSIISMVEDVTAQERARGELRESEERYRMLVENAPDAIIVHRAGNVLFANPATAALVGASAPAHLNGMSILDFVAPESRERMIGAVRRMEESRGPAFHPDIQLQRLDGEIIDAELTAIPIDFEREPSVLVLARNVTQKKRAERAHQESEERYRTLVESAPDGIMVRSGDTIVFANSTAAHLLGCEVPELVGRNVWEIIHPDDRELVRQRVHEVDEQRQRTEIGDYRLVRCDGAAIEVEAVGAPTSWSGNAAAQIIFRDVTDRNAARRALHRSEERYRRVVDYAPDAIVVHSDGHILYANRAAGALVKVADPERLVGADLLSFIDPQSRWPVMERLQQRRANPTDVLHYPLELRWMDGSHISADITAVPIDYAGTSAILLHIQDVTEAKQAEAALRSSEERYRRVVESMNEGLAVLDDQQRTVYANEQFCRIVNQRPEEFIGKNASMHWAPADEEEMSHLLERRRRGIAERYEAVRKRRSGDEIAISVSASPVMENGRFFGSVVLVSDISDRMKAEEALRGSEERYRMVVEHSPDAIVVHSCGRLVFANPAAAALVHAESVSEFVGRPILDFIHPDSVGEVQSRMGNRANSRSVSKYEVKLRALDQAIVLADVTAIPIEYGDDGQAVLVMLRDITERKLTEQRLRESEERYRELLDSSPNFIFSVDNENRYITVNRSVCEAFGRPASEIIGRTPFEMGLPPEPAREWADAHAIVRRTGQPYAHDTSIRHADGRTVITRSLLSPLRDGAGALVGVSGIAIDMTEQTRAQEAVQRLLSAVEQIEEVMFTTDLEGRITYVNPAFERVYGYSPEEVIGKTPRILKSGLVAQQHYDEFWRSILAGSAVRTQYVNRTKSGSLVTVVGSASPVFGKEGRIAGFIAIQQDVTEQRAMEESQRRLDERLQHLAKMESLGTLAGGVAHDFNNILSIILSHATVIERRASDADRVKSGVTTIRQAVHRGAALSKQILTFARRGDFDGQPVEIPRIVTELASMVSETFPRTIQMSLWADPDLPKINGDAGQIHQALLNLCVNARDAMPSGGTIRIEAKLISAQQMRSNFADQSSRKFVALVVSDTGVGMDDETRRRIFEPFFTTKEKGKGTGLGLALVYGVVKSHNGYIEVDSEPGRGTAFRLYFPATQATAHIDSSSDDASGRGQETLLVVDDEEALLAMVAACLRESGYEVIQASNGDKAVDRCRAAAGSIDAVVMDLGMPGMSPVETISALRELVPAIPIVAMTGYVDPDMHTQVIAAGVSQILQKPFDPDDLLRRVRSVLDAKPGRSVPARLASGA